jgi:hypothetical protein
MEIQVSKEKEQKAVDLKKAVAVADRVELLNVRLIQSDCLLKPSGLKGPYELNVDFVVNVQYDESKKNIAILPSFKLDAFVKDAKKEEPDFNIYATFLLNYKIDSFEGLDKECIQAFGYANGLYNAWPYWREYIQNTAVRMGLPNMTIPVFRLVPQEKKEEVRVSESKNTTDKKVLKKRKEK